MSARRLRYPVWGVLLLAAAGGGCMRQAYQPTYLPDNPPPTVAPRELQKINHPEYMIEPPDILQIDVLYAVPLPPYKIAPLDTLLVRSPAAPMTEPINGPFAVDPDGTIDLGGNYGKVPVVGMTLPEARAAIEAHLKRILTDPKTDVTLLESRAAQQIRGPHLVRPDGTVSLGKYGSANLTGLTLAQAKQKLEAHLAQFLQNPEVTVDVLAYNSKVYYVISDFGGSGQQIARLPVTGNETVLDAISQLGGLSAVADTRRIWVARAGDNGCEQILPVDWNGLTAYGRANTNYQLLPGDRVFVMAYPMIAFDTRLARVFAPIERILGITLLGASAGRQLSGNLGTFGGNTGGINGNLNVIR